MMFDLKKILDLRKIFAVPKNFHKLKNYSTRPNSVVSSALTYIPIKIFYNTYLVNFYKEYTRYD